MLLLDPVMSRVHPAQSTHGVEGAVEWEKPLVLTVWKKSSMAFQGTDGFSVFDKAGKLAFRVENYSRKTGGLVLMDGRGRALLTLRPQMLSMYEQWNGFEGDRESKKGSETPLFSMRKQSILQKTDQAEVYLGGSRRSCGSGGGGHSPDFRADGCFRRRHCKIRCGSGEVAAEISRKKGNTTVLLSEDVFCLVVQPGFSCELIMAFIVILDRICKNPFTPFLCS